MKKYFKILCSLLLVIIFGCQHTEKSYTESDDLIELKAIRQKERMINFKSQRRMSEKDGRFWDKVYPEITGVPDSLKEVDVYYYGIHLMQALYQSYKAGDVKSEDFEYYYKAWQNSDTTNCSVDYVNTFVVIVTGKTNSGKYYYMFDSNNNHDFADEIAYETIKSPSSSFGKNPNLEFQPHKIVFEKYVDNSIQEDFKWISFSKRNGKMWIQFNEITETSFLFNSIRYKIKTYPSTGGEPRYGISSFFKLSKPDKPYQRSKLFDIGEYIDLGTSKYKINCSQDGLKVYLSKDKSLSHIESTQIGYAPISFKALTYSNDNINFPSDFKGKYVLLDFWSTSCAPCVQEIKENYIELYERYGGKNFEIIGVADNLATELKTFIEKNNIRWTIVPDKEKKLILKKYNISKYPTLFLINPEGKIILKDDDLRGEKLMVELNERIKSN
ncbi:TlpA disulfide reductase family protein [uncultured Draconibacterium sp.]|uniref:peroxiredoxin family protein n=1 Tax=uncultured Draconibacterium sp. TaxID=1573823 RepID=UPI002AA9008A|nr:TlpA disulfide reductase family protein [uncultured Draconibacterium sp.]